jgi:Tol biopolymer transport system component
MGLGIKWLPDSRAVTIFGMEQGNTTDIWLVSLREGDPPVNLTRDDPSTIWSYSLSPDGRYIAYPAEIQRGSSLWRIDLRP